MNEEEVRRAGVFRRVKEGELPLVDAALMLRISYRQGKRLWRRYREEGARGLVHRSAGRPSNRAKPPKFRERVLGLVRGKYSGNAEERFGPTLAAEHLASEDGLEVDAETLRRWMLVEGLWSRQRKRKPYRQRRERKKHFGELVQMDGSFHDWFEQRATSDCLLNMVDDATGVTLAEFSGQETMWAAVDVLRQWIERYGVPRALYTDWKNVYVRPPTEAEKLSGEAPETQFGRMCRQLGIRIIAANSPQAKGRVERNHGVHQDRLVKKLRRKKICDRARANQYLHQEYLPEHNRRFAQKPLEPEDYHLAAPHRRMLEEIFRREEERTLSNDWVVRYHGRSLQLERERGRYAPARSKVSVTENRDGTLQVFYRGRRMRWRELATPVVSPAPVPTPAIPRVEIRNGAKPAADHPWRKGFGPMRPGWVGPQPIRRARCSPSGEVQKQDFPSGTTAQVNLNTRGHS